MWLHFVFHFVILCMTVGLKSNDQPSTGKSRETTWHDNEKKNVGFQPKWTLGVSGIRYLYFPLFFCSTSRTPFVPVWHCGKRHVCGPRDLGDLGGSCRKEAPLLQHQKSGEVNFIAHQMGFQAPSRVKTQATSASCPLLTWLPNLPRKLAYSKTIQSIIILLTPNLNTGAVPRGVQFWCLRQARCSREMSWIQIWFDTVWIHIRSWRHSED